MNKYIFGVDIGGTTVKCGLFTESGELIEKWEIPTNRSDNGSHILSEIAETISEKRKTDIGENHDIIGIGVGVPGPVQGSRLVKKCVNLGWGEKDVAKELEELTGIPVKVGNDANIAALGEMVNGCGRGCRNLAMLTLGTGVGGGIVLNGQIIEGADGAGGEIGHIHVNDTETESCGCGNKGCLEQYASATGLVRMARKAIMEAALETSLKDDDTLSAAYIFAKAYEKDALASELVEEYGKLLGKTIAQIACVINPEVFVIGGGVSKAGDLLLTTIQKYFRVYSFHASRQTEIKLATLGNDAGIYGAMGMILN